MSVASTAVSPTLRERFLADECRQMRNCYTVLRGNSEANWWSSQKKVEMEMFRIHDIGRMFKACLGV